MTKMEETHCMGEAAAELSAVRKSIGCLETKAERYRRVLSQASRALHDDNDDGFPEESEWPSLSDMERLRDDLSAARTKRHKLTNRLREWGVID